ncbi:MAG: hypothetical protein ACYCQK_07200 [Acidiferrobacteraceae bacterium]
MSKLKDKLSANMRNVRENPQPGSGDTARRVPDAAVRPAPKTPAPHAKPAGAKPAPARSLGGEVPESGTALFPERVWPD